MFGWLLQKSSATRPIVPRGSPGALTFFQVRPPSVLLYIALPGPPPLNPHAVRWRWYIAAQRLFALLGSITSSVAPVFSSTYNVLFHVLPPSVVMNTPRSAFGA